MANLDSAIQIGKETTYGTYAAPTRGYEGKEDNFSASVVPIESLGFRAGIEATRVDRVTMMDRGGTGSIQVDFLNKGMGLLLQGCLGGLIAPTQQGATAAYKATFQSQPEGPTESFTVQVLRSRIGGTLDPFTHLGTMFTGWSLAQNNSGYLVLTADLDFQTVITNQAAPASVYPANASPFHFGQAKLQINGVDFANVTDFQFGTDLGMKVDRFYLRNNPLKDKPLRQAIPTYSGTIQTDYTDLSRFAEFKAGTIVQNLTVTWTGSLIASTFYNEVKLTLPAVMWTGESPKATLTGFTTQPLPFKVLDNGTDPAVKLEVTSTDTTY